MDKIHVSKKAFRCSYCNKDRMGAYRIVDGYKSCEKCNRAYDYIPPKQEKIECPICKGKGYIE